MRSCFLQPDSPLEQKEKFVQDTENTHFLKIYWGPALGYILGGGSERGKSGEKLKTNDLTSIVCQMSTV